MSRTTVVTAIGTAALLVAACSSSKAASNGSTSAPPPVSASTSQPPVSVPATSAATSAAPSSSSAAAAALSGTWNGKYSGSFSGTFVLNWAQSSSKLTGTIKLSTPSVSVPINGTVSGGRIQFGTVGSTAITYSGSVSGNSMSGQYQVNGGAGGSGSWTAVKA